MLWSRFVLKRSITMFGNHGTSFIERYWYSKNKMAARYLVKFPLLTDLRRRVCMAVRTCLNVSEWARQHMYKGTLRRTGHSYWPSLGVGPYDGPVWEDASVS